MSENNHNPEYTIERCQDHSKEKIVYWCEQCNKNICSTCIIDRHKGHDGI